MAQERRAQCNESPGCSSHVQSHRFRSWKAVLLVGARAARHEAPKRPAEQSATCRRDPPRSASSSAYAALVRDLKLAALYIRRRRYILLVSLALL